MAYQHTENADLADVPHRLLNGAKRALAAIWHALISASEANRRMIIVQRLNEKTDTELAALGIRREDIVRRVFIDMLDV